MISIIYRHLSLSVRMYIAFIRLYQKMGVSGQTNLKKKQSFGLQLTEDSGIDWRESGKI